MFSIPADSRRLSVRRIAVCFFTLVANGSLALPVAERQELEELVVTGVRESQVLQIPKNVSVITADDIDLAPGNSLVDLLAREANINLRSFSGTDKNSGVDMRGMGDTYTSNVLVLLNGIAINAADLSGADFSTIDLNSIERIEIIRGGGAVRYGGGAVGGVINIITKPATDQFTGSIKLTGASEDTWGVNTAVSGQSDGWYYQTSATDYKTDGYRDNGYLDKTDLAFLLGHQFQFGLDSSLQYFSHRDSYGLPGPVDALAFKGTDQQRRQATTPYDYGETDDQQVVWRNALSLSANKSVSLELGLRNRNNPYFIGYGDIAPAQRGAGDAISEDSKDALLKYHQQNWLDIEQLQLDVGIAWSHTDYKRFANRSKAVDNSNVIDGELTQYAVYASLEQQTGWGSLSLGYRSDVTRVEQQINRPVSLYQTVFVDQIIMVEMPGGVMVPVTIQVPVQEKTGETLLRNELIDDNWHNHAFEAGLVYRLADKHSLYLSYMRGFRNPNVDELVLSPQSAEGESNLVPQQNYHWDIGYRYVATSLQLTVSAYQIDIDDEILYGYEPATNLTLNRNADETTRRRGLESEIRWQVQHRLSLLLNAAYTHARFQGSDAAIPLVPEKTFSAGMEWQWAQYSYFSINFNYVGPRPDGNAFSSTDNPYSDLKSYNTVDLKLIQQWQQWQLSFGINNLLDEVYASSVYSGSYYPMPARNLYLNLGYSF